MALAILFTLGGGAPLTTPALAQADDPNPPEAVVKLIFIHHSTGENWLTDGYGDLGITLGQNNYFVSDTNYGWGPDAIGDRTDIVNWTEWFRGPDSDRFMTALYTENGQNSNYTRNLPDPGGENEIVMFKSCFPNSSLEGNPGDAAAPGDGLTVSNAKYIYTDLLNYFVTRPDKLFVVITAPPLTDPTYADNARAFNDWLVNDWLRENNYPYLNVVVFDFYNVLTHPDNHHYFRDGTIEHVIAQEHNTSSYPSEDDHPSVAGSRKATEEFVPLLNVFYHRWKAGAPVLPPAELPSPMPVERTQPPIAPPLVSNDLIDDFESGTPPNSEGWIPYWDEATQTQISCGAEGGNVHGGAMALHINYSVQANSWATCALEYEPMPDWRTAQGISFYVHASQPATVFDVNAYYGTPDDKETYLFGVETTQEMVDGWVYLEFPWNMLLRADWEAETGAPFNPAVVRGLAFGFNTPPDAPNTGEIWFDDIHLIGLQAPSPEATIQPQEPAATAVSENQEPVSTEVTAPTETPEPEESGGLRQLCSGSFILGTLALVGVVQARKRNRVR